MEAKDAVNRFLEVMGKEIGAALALDHEGICLMENDDGTECEISALPDTESFLLTSLAGEASGESPETFYAQLMVLNSDLAQTAGATIGLDQASNLLMLHQMHSVRGLEQEDFENLIQEFVALTENLVKTIHELERGAAHLASAATGQAADNAPPAAQQSPHWHRV